MPLQVRHAAAARRRDDVDVRGVRREHERGGRAAPGAAEGRARQRQREEGVGDVVHAWYITVMLRRIVPALVVLMALPAPAFAWGRRRAPIHHAPRHRSAARRRSSRSSSTSATSWCCAATIRICGGWFDDEAPNHQIDFGVADYGPYPFAALPREYDKAVEKFGGPPFGVTACCPGGLKRSSAPCGARSRGSRNQLYADTNTVLYAAALAPLHRRRDTSRCTCTTTSTVS